MSKPEQKPERKRERRHGFDLTPPPPPPLSDKYFSEMARAAFAAAREAKEARWKRFNSPENSARTARMRCGS